MTATLEAIARAAIDACGGERLCREAAGGLPEGRLHLVGAGKAAAAMARGVAQGLGRRHTLAGGLVVTKDGHAAGFVPAGVALTFAGHPLPDARSARAGARLADYLYFVPRGDRVVALISGGASSLLASPVPAIALDDLVATTRALIASGAGIAAINAVRKHLTIASGGRLARGCAAPIEVLLLSDVLGDDIGTIGSGPFAPDETTFEQALAIARGVPGVPAAVTSYLERGARGGEVDTPDAAAACFSRVRHRVLANHDTLRQEAARAAREHGLTRVRFLEAQQGDVRRAAEALVAAARDVAPGELAIGGGEPTVALPDDHGLGGRNQQLALMVARGIAGSDAQVLVAGSDGSDGPTDAAGAVVDGQSWAALEAHGDPEAAIARCDATPILDAAGATIRTGPTGTNLLDLHLVARAT